MADTVSDRLYLGRITPGMDVCDVTGDKVGSIVHVYRVDEGQVTSADDGVPDVAEPIIEVRTGFLGLGKHLYIPMSAVQEVLTNSVFVASPRDSFEQLGYETKPEHLSRLS